MIEVEPADQPNDRQATERADDGAEPHMDDEAGDQVENQYLGLGVGAGGDDLHQRDGEEDGDGIVGAGLDLQRGTDTVTELQVTCTQQEENRGCVGGGDRCAEQEGFQPAETGQIEGHDAEQPGGNNDANRGKRHGRQRGLPESGDWRSETGSRTG